MLVFLMQIIAKSGVELLTLLAGIFIIGFILGQMEGLANQTLWRTFGKKGILVSAFIGTPVHEMSHLIMCFVFHHKVEKVKLIQFRSNDGTLGFVRHRYNPGSLYQKMGNFFIGIAPIIGGIVTVFLLMNWLMPETFHTCIRLILSYNHGETSRGTNALFALGLALLRTVFAWHNLGSFRFWLFLLLSMGVSAHVSLSKEDVRGAVSGITSLFILLFLINSGMALLGFEMGSLESIFLMGNLYLVTTGSLVIGLSAIHLALTGLFRLVLGQRNHYGLPSRDPFDVD